MVIRSPKKPCRDCEYSMCAPHALSTLLIRGIMTLLVTFPVSAMAWQYLGLDLWPW